MALERERERERESRNLEKIEEREGLYSKNRPLFICTAKVRQGKSVSSISGITLIALVVTIVVLLILASVSITVVFGDNGILQLTKEAGEKTNFANEKEVIQLKMTNIKTKLVTGAKISEEEYIGEKLSAMSVVAGDWKNVTVGDKTYENGWYLLEKGNNIPDYGEANNNWLMNYESGELIQLEEEKYIVASSNASGAIVDETLKLNIDPSNLQDKSKWENGETKVSIWGGDIDTFATKTELKFDGQDDYLKIEGLNINRSDGITFEFYGKNYGGDIYPLEKTDVSVDGKISEWTQTRFRIGLTSKNLECCLGTGNCGSDDFSDAKNDREHWLVFPGLKLSNDYDYFSLTVNFQNGDIEVYNNGVSIHKTKCSLDYLDTCDAFNSKYPFTIGMQAFGSYPVSGHYSQFDLYACRLYTRVLTDEEISKNYIATTNYHNKLVNN